MSKIARRPILGGGLRVLTKYRKNEAFIRNDGVYVISGIFREQMLAKRRRPEGLKCRAHEVRSRRPRSGWRREDTPKGRPQRRNTAPP